MASTKTDCRVLAEMSAEQIHVAESLVKVAMNRSIDGVLKSNGLQVTSSRKVAISVNDTEFYVLNGFHECLMSGLKDKRDKILGRN